jgi:hypothetical protein
VYEHVDVELLGACNLSTRRRALCVPHGDGDGEGGFVVFFYMGGFLSLNRWPHSPDFSGGEFRTQSAPLGDMEYSFLLLQSVSNALKTKTHIVTSIQIRYDDLGYDRWKLHHLLTTKSILTYLLAQSAFNGVLPFVFFDERLDMYSKLRNNRSAMMQTHRARFLIEGKRRRKSARLARARR